MEAAGDIFGRLCPVFGGAGSIAITHFTPISLLES